MPCTSRGIGIYGTFVFGYDADTRDTIDRTVDFALESRLEIANFNPLTPTPGSALYDRLRDEGRLLSPQWWLDPDYRYGDAIFEPRGMSADELAEGVFEARGRFYSWRSIGVRVLWREVPFSPFRIGHDGGRQHHLAPRDLQEAASAIWGAERHEDHLHQAEHRPHGAQPVRRRGAHGAADAGGAGRPDAAGRRVRAVRRPHGADPVRRVRPIWRRSPSRPTPRAAPTRSPPSTARAACR